jgi:enoyl-CoA hydratase/carnithine racemase
MTQGEIRGEVRDGVGWITIARPAKRNALTRAMWKELPHAIGDLAARDEVVGIALLGEGGNFGAGADLKDVLAATAGRVEAEAYCTEVVTALLAVAACPLPTVALISGVAAGGGAEIAVACDLRFAETGATFSFPFARLGVVPDRFTLARLLSLVGTSAAKRLVFSGEILDAHAAHGLGLVDEVVDSGRLETAGSAWLSALRDGSRGARAAMKRALLEREALLGVGALAVPMVESFLSGDVSAAARRFLVRP